MTKLPLIAFAALFAAGLAPAHAAGDCGLDAKSFFEKLMLNGSNKMSGDQLTEAMRKGVRAYDACKSGDTFTVHGVWDQIDAEKAGK